MSTAEPTSREPPWISSSTWSPNTASPRLVEAERDGYWWSGFQHAWRLCDDGRGWMAAVEYVAVYDWGRGKHLD